MMDIFVFLLYRWALLPIVFFVLKIFRPLLPQKIQQMFADRATPQRPVLWARPIWIHAASGEVEYAKPVIRELKEQFPEIPILMTYFSPSAVKLLQKVEGLDFAVPLPFDQATKIRAFIHYCQPLAVLFARTDVWPELALQLRQKNIPTLLFSATLADNSSRTRGLSRFLSRFALDQLTEISCVNEEDLRNFKALGVRTRASTLGDTRFDQTLFRLAHAKPLRLELAPRGKNVFVAGSTWPQDEKIILPALKSWLTAQPSDGNQAILAPHEVTEDHLLEIEKSLEQLGLYSVRYSRAPAQALSPLTVLVIDQVGILPEIYTWGTVAFVGGSFKDRVHSVMEPLAAGLPVIVGPYHQNNREALQFGLQFVADKVTAVTTVQNSEEFAQSLSLLSKMRENHPEVHGKIQALVKARAGVSRQISRWVPLVKAVELLQPQGQSRRP